MIKGQAWENGRYIDIEVCCDNMAEAACAGTDSGMYGSLFSFYNDEWHGGCHDTPLKFCPWCGKSL
jgi:hypothetical protein